LAKVISVKIVVVGRIAANAFNEKERRVKVVCIVIGLAAMSSLPARAEVDLAAANRGRHALETRAFNPPAWRIAAYDDAWKFWGNLKTKPAEYDRAFMNRYGLHPAPFDNGRFPMGVRAADSLLIGKGLATDCLMCHGSSILGKSYIGLGNASLDIQAFYEDVSRAAGRSGKTPFTFSNVRGTSEAGGMAVFLLGYREPDLRLRLKRLDLGLRDDLCEDVPAWWLLKKKKTMYHTGTTDARSVRSLMQFMMTPLNLRPAFDREEAVFRDIQAYLRSLEPPRFPFPIDRALAKKGEAIFRDTCARCHGTYGEQWTYPNKIVPIDVIGTDRSRFDGITDRFGEYYNQSWFAKETGDGYKAGHRVGYLAPPLDAIWATAPYFHNGCAPTVYHVLNSRARPRVFTRSYRTDADAYDPVKLGWKIQVLERPPRNISPLERRKIYDTTQPGRGNGGHTFGDHLSDPERMAVIEYLKTL
jgi:hypothetical protein